ncbi:polysaccharide deacetylase family protein [Thalassotalea eurytherma]|uniref:WalW protein n=1 Tax=Thalassotalea eurytherma TaxID=1144278 RepID=A0ABQ6H5G3_9GAMM|nr:polysaccharide deacetylase family protein [Thalassotalea eurytherma]GLX82111.1 hypothetical protein theurythT_15630 [Thalassotalea eurytherma]
MDKPKVFFVLSVDTEEEWDWSGPFPNDNFCVDNTKELPAFQNFCQELQIKPTYLVDYPVANDEYASQVLKSFGSDNCEIGAHLHPWANPPFFNETSDFTSHVINLSVEQTKQKLNQLIEKIEANIGVEPKSFRTGRWGINGDVLKLLIDQGIDVDTSIYPLYVNDHFTCENASRVPYWPDFQNTNEAGEQRDIFEIPVTCGFNRSSTSLAQKLHKLCEKPPFNWLRINGLLWHTLILRKLYLSPELCSENDMVRLVKSKLKNNHSVFHMYLHSSSLIERVTGLNNEPHARELICKRIQHVVQYLTSVADVEFCTLSQVKASMTTGRA